MYRSIFYNNGNDNNNYETIFNSSEVSIMKTIDRITHLKRVITHTEQVSQARRVSKRI